MGQEGIEDPSSASGSPTRTSLSHPPPPLRLRQSIIHLYYFYAESRHPTPHTLFLHLITSFVSINCCIDSEI